MSEEIPQQLYDEALGRSEAFYIKIISWDNIIDWADSWIARLDDLPEALMDVSLSRSRRREGEDALSQLAREGIYATVLPFLKELWLERYTLGEVDFKELVKEIYDYNESGIWQNGDRLIWLGDEVMFVLENIALMEEPYIEYSLSDADKLGLLKSAKEEVLEWLSQ